MFPAWAVVNLVHQIDLVCTAQLIAAARRLACRQSDLAPAVVMNLGATGGAELKASAMVGGGPGWLILMWWRR